MNEDRMYERWKRQRQTAGPGPSGAFDERVMAAIEAEAETPVDGRRPTRIGSVLAMAAVVVVGLAVGLARWALAVEIGLK